jgi:hypothetical protein
MAGTVPAIFFAPAIFFCAGHFFWPAILSCRPFHVTRDTAKRAAGFSCALSTPCAAAAS